MPGQYARPVRLTLFTLRKYYSMWKRDAMGADRERPTLLGPFRGDHEAIHDLFQARLIEGDFELVVVRADHGTVAEFLMEDPRA